MPKGETTMTVKRVKTLDLNTPVNDPQIGFEGHVLNEIAAVHKVPVAEVGEITMRDLFDDLTESFGISGYRGDMGIIGYSKVVGNYLESYLGGYPEKTEDARRLFGDSWGEDPQAQAMGHQVNASSQAAQAQTAQQPPANTAAVQTAQQPQAQPQRQGNQGNAQTQRQQHNVSFWRTAGTIAKATGLLLLLVFAAFLVAFTALGGLGVLQEVSVVAGSSRAVPADPSLNTMPVVAKSGDVATNTGDTGTAQGQNDTTGNSGIGGGGSNLTTASGDTSTDDNTAPGAVTTHEKTEDVCVCQNIGMTWKDYLVQGYKVLELPEGCETWWSGDPATVIVNGVAKTYTTRWTLFVAGPAKIEVSGVDPSKVHFHQSPIGGTNANNRDGADENDYFKDGKFYPRPEIFR